MVAVSAAGAATPTIVSRTNSTAANGVLYAAAKPAAVPDAISTRVRSCGVFMIRPTAAPSVPPTSISGPSRPMDMPPAIAVHDEATRDIVVRSESCTLPRTTASITLLTPCRVALNLEITPAAAPPAAGTQRRSHHGRFVIASTTSVALKTARYQSARRLRNTMAKAAVPRETRTSEKA